MPDELCDDEQASAETAHVDSSKVAGELTIGAAIPPEVQQRINILENLVDQLKSQLDSLRQAGVVGTEEDAPGFFPLETVDKEFKAACERLMQAMGEDSDPMAETQAQAEFDKWERRLAEHPDKIAADLEAEKAWHVAQAPLNQAALHIVQSFVPMPSDLSLAVLNQGLPKQLAERIWAKKCLWMVRMPNDAIAKLHVADLSTRFAPHKLDVIELRAVFASLPETFENDKGGEKLAWRTAIKEKLRQAILDQASGKLTAAEMRNEAYFTQSSDLSEKSSETSPNEISLAVQLSPLFRGTFGCADDVKLGLEAKESLILLDEETKAACLLHKRDLEAAAAKRSLRSKPRALASSSRPSGKNDSAFASQLAGLLGGGSRGRGRGRGALPLGRGALPLGRGALPKNSNRRSSTSAAGHVAEGKTGNNISAVKDAEIEAPNIQNDDSSAVGSRPGSPTKVKFSDIMSRFETPSKRAVSKAQEERSSDLQTLRRQSSSAKPRAAKEEFCKTLDSTLARSSKNRFTTSQSSCGRKSETLNQRTNALGKSKAPVAPGMSESWVQISESEKNEADKIEQLVIVLQAQIADLQKSSVGMGSLSVQPPNKCNVEPSASASLQAATEDTPASATGQYSFVERPTNGQLPRKQETSSASSAILSFLENPSQSKVTSFVSNLSGNLRSLMLEKEYRNLTVNPPPLYEDDDNSCENDDDTTLVSRGREQVEDDWVVDFLK